MYLVSQDKSPRFCQSGSTIHILKQISCSKFFRFRLPMKRGSTYKSNDRINHPVFCELGSMILSVRTNHHVSFPTVFYFSAFLKFLWLRSAQSLQTRNEADKPKYWNSGTWKMTISMFRDGIKNISGCPTILLFHVFLDVIQLDHCILANSEVWNFSL